MEDLQSLLEKINRDGVEKADAEAKKIIDHAKAQAVTITEDARAKAAQAKAEAEKSSAEYAARAEETIRQAARDIILAVEGSVRSLLEKLLVQNVNAALSDDANIRAVTAAAIENLVGPGEIACSDKLAQTLAAQLAAKKEFTVVTDDAIDTGFTVKLDGGRVVHAFTGEVIASELAKRLRPDLAKLIK